MSIAEVVLQRLDKAREHGAGRWMARCPAHEDRSPSLTVREVGDRVLLHCFAGCETQAVLEAIGLQWRDLFEASLSDEAREAYVSRRRASEIATARLAASMDVPRLARWAQLTPDQEARAAQAQAAARAMLAEAGMVDAPPRSLQPVGGPLLWSQRAAGRHPARVWVLAGGDWRKPPGESAPKLMVRTSTPPAALDWRVVAGLAVHVVPRGHEALRELVADVAAWAAPVVVHASRQADAGEWLLATDWSADARADYLRRRRRAEAAVLADEMERTGQQPGAKGVRKRARAIRDHLEAG